MIIISQNTITIYYQNNKFQIILNISVAYHLNSLCGTAKIEEKMIAKVDQLISTGETAGGLLKVHLLK